MPEEVPDGFSFLLSYDFLTIYYINAVRQAAGIFSNISAVEREYTPVGRFVSANLLYPRGSLIKDEAHAGFCIYLSVSVIDVRVGK